MATTLRERALASVAEAEARQRAAAAVRAKGEDDRQREWARRALEARFDLTVPDTAIRRVSETCLAVAVEGDTLHAYPVSGSVRVAADYACGHLWESGDIRDVQALGFALLRRDIEAAGSCYRCQHTW